MSYSKEKIIEALRTVNDPDLKKDLVTLNMIKDIETGGNTIKFKVELTTPACPLKDKIEEDCRNAIHEIVDPGADVQIEMTSRVTTKRKEARQMMQGVKNIVAVASGKGGVGKSTIAANLAISLSRNGAKVGLLDADIYGPSIPRMFDLEDARPYATEKDGKQMVIPIEKYGIHILSIGFFVDRSKALIWRGPMASNALTQLFTEVDWGELDYLVIDLPPGTGDIHLTVVQQVPVTGAVIVTTPQEVALADARKAFSMFNQEQIKVPVLGLVENMSYFTPAELPENKYYIFGKEGGRKLAEESNVSFLGGIPLVQSVRESGDNGSPVTLFEKEQVAQAFDTVAQNTARQIAIVNANMEPAEKIGHTE
ncbi:MAG: Mrp/NBP35 family ATP-binding protein [Bacteroidales bacterium]|nr:Mrp/NBP35 family ATP-binding protein [Bacteroidales bacterium]